MSFVDDKSIEPKKQTIILLLSLIISTVSGFVPDWTGAPFSTADQILFSTLIFIVFLILDVLWVLVQRNAWI